MHFIRRKSFFTVLFTVTGKISRTHIVFDGLSVCENWAWACFQTVEWEWFSVNRNRITGRFKNTIYSHINGKSDSANWFDSIFNDRYGTHTWKKNSTLPLHCRPDVYAIMSVARSKPVSRHFFSSDESISLNN